MPAVRSIGTNAIPCLLTWAGYDLPPWRRTLYQFLPRKLKVNQNVTRAVSGERYFLAGAAATGFTILGTNAVVAIPPLEVMMNDKKRGWSAGRAIEVLSGLGTPAFPALTNAVADPQHTWRVLITVKLGEMALTSPIDGTNLYLPVLRQLMSHPDYLVNSAASNAIHRIETNLHKANHGD